MTVVSKYPKFILFAVVLFVINLLVMNNGVAYWDEDEAAYAGFAIEMLQTGDWVNPNFEHATIHRKTPLHFWTIASCYKLFGTNEFATRLPSSIAILLTCFLVFRLGRNLWGEKIACRAALILMSSIAIPIMGKMAFTDATLLCFSTLSVLSLLNYMEQPNWRWNLGLLARNCFWNIDQRSTNYFTTRRNVAVVSDFSSEPKESHWNTSLDFWTYCFVTFCLLVLLVLLAGLQLLAK